MVNSIVQDISKNTTATSPHSISDQSPQTVNSSVSGALSESDWSASARELLDSVPRVWTKGLLYLLVGFAAAVIPYTAVSRVDETGSAKGRLEPQGMLYRLDAPVAGSVTQVRVKTGQSVKAGQVLMELDADLV